MGAALAVPFFTDEDPNARIKGSRDPLGIMPVWAGFGRHVVGNLTTQSTSVRGFTIVLLGRWLGERLVERGELPREEALDVFLRMEQVGAYVRCAAHGVEGEIRGIERVKGNLHEYGGQPYIGTESRALILSDQKIYGLWGIYSVPARRSGWLADGPLGLTPVAREFVDQFYAPVLGRAVRGLEDLVSRGGRLSTKGKGDAVFGALRDVLQPKFTAEEQAFYGKYLRDCDFDEAMSAGTKQRMLRELAQEGNHLDEPLGRKEALELVDAARERSEDLARCLRRIVVLECLFAPASVVYDLILARGGTSVGGVADEIGDLWGPSVPNLDPTEFSDLLAEIRAATSPELTRRIESCHGALSVGDYPAAIRGLIDWNRLVMEGRGSGPWVRIDSDDVLDVRYRGAEQAFPSREELGELWSNSYFIDALKSVTRQLGGDESIGGRA